MIYVDDHGLNCPQHQGWYESSKIIGMYLVKKWLRMEILLVLGDWKGHHTIHQIMIHHYDCKSINFPRGIVLSLSEYEDGKFLQTINYIF